jgi:uncharacterized phage-associated protein
MTRRLSEGAEQVIRRRRHPMEADDVILNVLRKVGGRVPATKLVKLVYLVDYVNFQHYGETMTGFEYQWGHYGPSAVGHGTIGAAEKLSKEGKVLYKLEQNAFGGTTKYFGLSQGSDIGALNAKGEMVLDDVVHKYGKLSVKQITAETKKTNPFKNAAQYDMLTMEHSLPALSATEEDAKAYHQDLEENGALSLEEIKKAYGI